jgi:hypothetical protein
MLNPKPKIKTTSCVGVTPFISMVPMTPNAFSHSPLSPRHLITVQYVDIYIIYTRIRKKREGKKESCARREGRGGGEGDNQDVKIYRQ